MEVSGKLEAPTGLTLGREPPVPMNGRLGGPKHGLVVTETKCSLDAAGN
jgi:hypothetical protein